MKTKILLAGLFAGISLAGFAQSKSSLPVPAAVKAAFEHQYPGTKAKWEKEDGNYEAAFTSKGVKTSAVYDKSGKLIETETAISGDAFPKAAKDYIAQKKLGPVTETAKIIKADGTVSYEAEIKKTDYLFDAKGAFLRAQKD
ncbi:PepSY-like domain-containing protein [Niabella drilacis]|uniref:Putative beta-lactamase-inhibitor-like, PepSY-like n=1 Tax=Niabella drilacis (strain DSM 25811 / CCM 8410 / CCUG 62505 / LMG 26954 / E90) TaxID=1285928 RepID=A0A1G7ALV7_NIADE|nr:PepSY-like domain-containing protein [Niabella drilacis]SDE15801.1 Putative beta-lactamase-inhibitor-like, PepSY-like [Niabella drilacis]